MAITTLDAYIASQKQIIPYVKTATRTTIANQFFSLFELAGNPGAGVLNAGNTVSGIVPISTNVGYPNLNTFAGGAQGYISRIIATGSVTHRVFLYDRLFVAGAYAFNADITLGTQPSYSGRVPGGTDFNGLQIWVENVTASTGNLAVTVDYTTQTDAAGSTGALGIGAVTTIGRCWQLPLAAGHNSVKTITRVRGTVATGGTFNIMVLRPLWSGHISLVGTNVLNDMLSTGLPEIWATSALYPLYAAVGTSSGLPMLQIEIASG